VKASKLPKVTFHGPQDSYASISPRAGTPLKVVSEMLGNTMTAITADLYTHVLGDLRAKRPIGSTHLQRCGKGSRRSRDRAA
jgi:integrase